MNHPGAAGPPAGAGDAAVSRVSAAALADALAEALAGLATVAVQPGYVAWSVVPEPARRADGRPPLRVKSL